MLIKFWLQTDRQIETQIDRQTNGWKKRIVGLHRSETVFGILVDLSQKKWNLGPGFSSF